MGISSVTGGALAGGLSTARAANDTFFKPLSAAVGPRPAPVNFTGAMQAAITKSAGGTTPTDLQRNAQTALNAFHQKLLGLLAGSNVDLSQEMRLESDGQGGLQVAGGNPDANKVTAVLHDHPELVAQFQSLAQAFQQLRAADPSHLADDSLHPPTFGLTLSGQQVQVSFE